MWIKQALETSEVLTNINKVAEKDLSLESRGVGGDFQKWKDIQMSKNQRRRKILKSKHDDDDDLAEKIYNGLETLIQEKISDFPEVSYKSEYN